MIIVKDRELLIPSNERYIGTNYDAGMENRVFRIPRFSQGGTDLSYLTFKINLIFDGDPLDRAEMAKVVEDDYIYLTWTVTSAQVAVTGTVFACVTGNDTNDTVKWSSFQAPFYTEKSLGDDIDTAYHNLFNRLDAEESTRARQDSLLQAQIDQLVAPSGEAPSAAEIENARVGVDGTVYNTLGNAIRTQLNKYTGGAFIELSANTDLNSITTPGNYYCAEANASGILNKPYDTNKAFNLRVESAFGDNTTYLLQIFRSRYVDDAAQIAVRNIRSNGTVGEWKKIPYSDTATITADGLLSSWDKRKLTALGQVASFEKELYPSPRSNVSGLLQLEKTNCVFHDNFWRANNATDIGNNGSGSRRYYYYDMASSSAEAQNIKVGISDHKAVATNPGNLVGAKRIKYKYTNPDMPYKVIMSFGDKGVLVISPTDTDNYIYVSATPNSFTVGGIGSFSTVTTTTVTHNLDIHTITAYVYDDHVTVYVAGQPKLTFNATSVNMFAGLLFTAEDVSTISYTNFDVFNTAENLCSYQDEGIEKASAFSNEIVNYSQTADYSYGVLLDSARTLHSVHSIRFEQRKEDSSEIYRSEITVKNPRGTDYNANFPLQTKIFEYDLYIPEDYGIDSEPEILWQMHHTPDGVVADGLIPNVVFNTHNGRFTVNVRSFEFKAQSSAEITDRREYDLGEYTPGTWYHVQVFIREGYRPEHDPCLAIWMDGELKVYDRSPNVYNTTNGSYLKMGIYKPSYVHQTATGTTKRVIYLDNLNVWM